MSFKYGDYYLKFSDVELKGNDKLHVLSAERIIESIKKMLSSKRPKTDH